MILKSTLTLLIGLFCIHATSCFGTPDLTIVGNFDPADGLGKVGINIIETLGDLVSINAIPINPETPFQNKDTPQNTLKAISNHDQETGQVALLTDVLWCISGKSADKIPANAQIKLAFSMIETSRIPAMWTSILNEEFDAVIVPDKSLIQVYKESGVIIPIFVLPIPMRLSPYFHLPVHSSLPSKPFVFGDASAKKNPSVLIKAFAKAFGNNPKVHLVLRAVHINQTELNNLIHKYKLKNVTIEDGALSLNQFIDRLSSFDCYVNLSHGEGFSFIPREALALGIPVIITNNTASTTICETGYVKGVPSTKKWSGSHYTNMFGDPCGHQFDCTVKDAAKALRDVYKNYNNYKNKAIEGKNWVKQYDISNQSLKDKYKTLVKPKYIVLGNDNIITEDTIYTNSTELYNKYIEIK